MKKFYSFIILIGTLAVSPLISPAQNVEIIKYGDFENWITRPIKESAIIGGKTKNVYEIGPEATIPGDRPYTNRGGSPWATSNVLAKVMGVTKTSNAVYPDTRSGSNRCAKLTTHMEQCKAIGVINVDVMVAGSIFLGKMLEPVKNTKNPYSKMEMGIPFTKRPKALRYDYKLSIPQGAGRIYSSGFGSKKELPGTDKAEVLVFLQRRWEDADGNIFAKRVGTGRELLGRSTSGWVNDHRLKINYGDITSTPGFKPFMGLIPEAKSYYARNSKGKMVPVREVGWDDASATPTHVILMMSSGSGEPYTGTPDMTFWVDNVGFVY